MTPEMLSLVEQVATRAESLFRHRSLLCAESILVACNEVFHGGLEHEQAVGMAAGMGEGLGDSGCLCGALNGGVLSLGLILPGNKTNQDRKLIRQASFELHKRFKERYKSTCCRVLTKKVKHDKKAHFSQCTGITKAGAYMTAEMLLELKPQLVNQALGQVLPHRETPWCGRMKWLLSWVCR